MQNGYRDFLKLADNFTAFNQRLKFAHYRPRDSVKIDPRSWWKYACKAVSDQMKKARFLPSYLNVKDVVMWSKTCKYRNLFFNYNSFAFCILRHVTFF